MVSRLHRSYRDDFRSRFKPGWAFHGTENNLEGRSEVRSRDMMAALRTHREARMHCHEGLKQRGSVSSSRTEEICCSWGRRTMSVPKEEISSDGRSQFRRTKSIPMRIWNRKVLVKSWEVIPRSQGKERSWRVNRWENPIVFSIAFSLPTNNEPLWDFGEVLSVCSWPR